MNGPVPTSLVTPHSLPAAFTASGETIPRYGFDAESRNGANAVLNFTTTVYSSTICVSWYGPIRLTPVCDLVSGFTIRSKVNLTAAALNGVPSWNLTPCRSLNVYSVAVSLTLHSVASPGENLPR